MMHDFLQWLPAFAEVMDRRYYTPAWLAGEVWSGRARFWSTERAALVAEIKAYPTGARDLHFLVAAGDLDALIETLRPEAEAWGRSTGCVAALVESRAGWARALAPHGYELHQTTIRKEL
ncbi:hypothetical protein Swit_4459 [Rhizorhabdus wittichii RW1]|uniref:Uncharacterized protein n=1 Tax=Rhizorhabdus wittichii (strain DSM 6014 / CCUG 31198 / JCM 15750 / NBRC 105917 / EY 4224 / RW1) TaxID=392499 RepID=A0A9J9HFW6_RHIWR|nr:hypothetical protein Swit_4459 [Rhizorhabdus wittichii RW1]